MVSRLRGKDIVLDLSQKPWPYQVGVGYPEKIFYRIYPKKHDPIREHMVIDRSIPWVTKLTRIHLHTPPNPTCSRWYDHEWLKADYKPDSPPMGYQSDYVLVLQRDYVHTDSQSVLLILNS